MPLPKLDSWEATRTTFHQASLVLSAFGKISRPADTVFWHHITLSIVPEGLTTGFTDFGKFLLDFNDGAAVYTTPKGDQHIIGLRGHSQKSLADALMNHVTSAGFRAEINREHIESDTKFEFDDSAATTFIEAANTVVAGFNAFRETLPKDEITDLVLFPHHFDFSFLWFNVPVENEHQPHMNFGFSGGDDAIPMPYLYAYAWSEGTGYITLDVPPPWQHHEAFTSGIMTAYDDLQSAGAVTKTLNAAKEAGLSLWG